MPRNAALTPQARHVLVILVDAFKLDYLTPQNTPFLQSQLGDSFFAPLHPILGYSDAIRATVFTGAYPQDHNYWIMQKYSPGTNPLRFLNALRFIDILPSNLFVRGLKFFISASLGRLLAKSHGYSLLTTHNMPYHLLASFDSTLRQSMLSPGAFPGHPTLFDVLKEGALRYSYIDISQWGLKALFGSSLRVRDRLSNTLARLEEDARLVFVYLHQLDHFAHSFSTTSPRFLRELTNMDGVIQLTVEGARKRLGPDLDVLIFSDHGMIDATHFLYPKELVRDRGLGKDYLLSLDSTMVRLWYLNPARREEIRGRVEGLGCGHFLTDTERQELKVAFSHRDYGDDIYLLEPGYTLFPNFISWVKPYAMHAYHPDHSSQAGIFLWLDRKKDVAHQGSVELVEIAPTILDLLGLTPPPTFKGQSLLNRKGEA